MKRGKPLKLATQIW